MVDSAIWSLDIKFTTKLVKNVYKRVGRILLKSLFRD